MTRDEALSFCSKSTDFKTLDYQRTNPREYQIVRTQRKLLECKIQHQPATSSTLCRMPHLNNKQSKNANPIISRQDYHHIQPCPSEEKQTKTQHKYHPIWSLQKPGPTLGGQKPKGRKNSIFFKERIQPALKPGERRPQTQ